MLQCSFLFIQEIIIFRTSCKLAIGNYKGLYNANIWMSAALWCISGNARPGDSAKHQNTLIPGQPYILLDAHWDQIVTNLPVCQSAVANMCMTFDTITYYSTTTIQRTFYTLIYCIDHIDYVNEIGNRSREP